MDLNMFATMFIGMFDPRTGQLAYINAGHNPPFIVGENGAIKSTLKPTGPAVGMFPGVDFEIEFTRFDPGDILFCYTDGVTEARAVDKSFYTEKRLLSVLSDPAPSATALVERVHDALNQFIAGAPRFDDITMIAVQRKAGDRP
jgi:sigma-B regulation protein RsbU (phosphoserine phosphatase)